MATLTLLLACTPSARRGAPEEVVRVDLRDAWPASDPGSVPLGGGATVALADGRIAAADPDGDRVRIVSADGADAVDVLLPPGSAPAVLAAAEDALHVLLRGAGAVATLGVEPPAVLRHVPACAAPRGLDAAPDGTVWIACQGGELVSVAPDGGATATIVEPDLRDVRVDGDGLVLTTFRHAELLEVTRDGTVLSRRAPPAPEGTEARVAWRLVPAPGGGFSMLHQLHATGPIDLSTDPEDPHRASYGNPDATGCDGLVRTAVTTFAPDGTISTVELDLGLSVDLAWDDRVLYVAGTRRDSPPRSELARFDDPSGPCATPETAYYPYQGALVAGVAVLPDAPPVAAMRSLFAVSVHDEPPADGVPDRGFDLFHAVAAPSLLACASCHADGAEDGHTWSFLPIGPRRTQDLASGLAGTAPYHWDGDLPDLTSLVLETANGRMGHEALSWLEIQALETWLEGLRPRRAASPASPEELLRGEALFHDPAVGCAGCHAGEALTTAATVDVGTGAAFQVPSLRGVGVRGPLLHDGCAAGVRERLVDPRCGGGAHGDVAGLGDEELQALAAWVDSL